MKFNVGAKLSSPLSTMMFVVKLYIKNAPFKILWECLLNAIKNIMVVITSVWLLQRLTELVLEGASFTESLLPLGIVTAANIVVGLICKFYTNCLKPQSDLKIKTQYEKIILNHAKQLPIHYYENSEFYTTLQQAQDGVSAVFSAYDDFVNIFAQVAAIVSAIRVTISIDPFLLLFVAFTFPMIMISRKISKRSAQKKLDMKLPDRRKAYAKSIWLEKNFAREFKTSNAAKVIDKQYDEAYESAMNIHSDYGRKLFGLNMFESCFSITSISVLSYLYCILKFTYVDSFYVSDVSVVVVSIMNMVSRIRRIYKSYGHVGKYQIQLNALKEFLQYSPEDENVDGMEPDVFQSLEFRQVWFSYDKQNWVLKNISFKINAGEKIAIVGYNGAGKSTLIKLMLRFYDIDRGEILYNGINIKKYKLNEYRRKFFAAFQDYQMFSVKLSENMLMKEYSLAEKEKLDTVLTDLNMEELVGKENCLLGREYDTQGLVLSGGQQQKIAVSRLNFDDFDIALLDEPSAALDPVSSYKMLNSVMRLVGNRTMLMVSHDMSFSKCADKTLFFEAGELAEMGSHAELMKQNSKYALFFMSQAKQYQSSAG